MVRILPYMLHGLQLNAWDMRGEGGGSKMEWVLNVDTGKIIFILPDIEYWEYSSIYKHKPTNSQTNDKAHKRTTSVCSSPAFPYLK